MVTLPCRLVIDLPNWLGDFIHTIPALQTLERANRGGVTCALLPPAHAPLAGLLGLRPFPRPPHAGFRWARHGLSERFDLALTARHSTRAKLLLAGTHAEQRLSSRGRGAQTLGLHTFAVDRSRHQRHDLDGALAAVGVAAVADGPVQIDVPPRLAQRGFAQRMLLAGRSPVVALFPATRHCPGKRYPLPAMAWLARELDRAGVVPLIFVGPGEEALATEVATGSSARIAPTSWALDEVGALLSACDAAVGSDSGLAHLAAVFGCPTVVVFGPTAPARTAPVGGSTVVQPLDGQRRMATDLAALPPEVLLQRVWGLLDAHRGTAIG